MKSKLAWNIDMNLEGQAHIKLVDEFGFWRAEVSIAVFRGLTKFKYIALSPNYLDISHHASTCPDKLHTSFKRC